ncbi:MAG: hypothetical protein D3X82_02400 [Candidatus Leucobacter sulfamidivorax]|nr:hypothetical protein [Candidatus Leucobacter sulfamidivorax]
MATLEKRVQVLFDPEQYALVEAAAKADGVSVGAFVREAVEMVLSEKGARASWQALWDRVDADPNRYEPVDWEDMKADWEREMVTVERTRGAEAAA